MEKKIEIFGARENNLKNIDLEFKKNNLLRLKLKYFLKIKISTVGTEKNNPIKIGKSKEIGDKKRCLSYIKKGETIQCIELKKNPIPKVIFRKFFFDKIKIIFF